MSRFYSRYCHQPLIKDRADCIFNRGTLVIQVELKYEETIHHYSNSCKMTCSNRICSIISLEPKPQPNLGMPNYTLFCRKPNKTTKITGGEGGGWGFDTAKLAKFDGLPCGCPMHVANFTSHDETYSTFMKSNGKTTNEKSWSFTITWYADTLREGNSNDRSGTVFKSILKYCLDTNLTE